MLKKEIVTVMTSRWLEPVSPLQKPVTVHPRLVHPKLVPPQEKPAKGSRVEE